MINCTYKSIDEHEFFNEVVAAKKTKYKTILIPISSNVKAAYDLYLQDFSRLCTQPLSCITDVSQVDALKKCYSIGTLPFNTFRQNVFLSQPAALQALCPYCMINSPDTLDHYVGQAAFPEYSILTKNLIPCCWKCNHKKEEEWRTSGSRNFINFYTDNFLDLPFLSSGLAWSVTRIPFIYYELVCPAELSANDFILISRHFTLLELTDKYALRANERLSTEIEICRQNAQEGADKDLIKSSLLSRFNSYTKRYGINYWEAQIYKVMAENISSILAM